MEGKYDMNTLNKFTCHIIQSERMTNKLISLGLNNVRYVPNCKKYFQVDDKTPQKEWLNPVCFKFVYLGRITKSKGVDLLLNVIKRLNDTFYEDKFSVDFYGIIEHSFKSEFDNYVSLLQNVKYRGPLPLQSKHGYDTLSKYHLMLFPTHHKSEGVAGVFIDAFIAGIPVLTTKWNCNEEIIIDGFNGIIIPANNEDALYERMKKILDKKIDLNIIAQGSKKSFEKYRSDVVISETLLREIGLI